MGDERPRVVLGVAGGIAAYKACDVLRSLSETGNRVDVIPSEAALRFVGTATFEALSGNPVSTDVFSDVPSVRHVKIGQEADLVVVVPATADLIARMAHGRADDLLTATLLTARCPVLIAPAMHTEMWEHPATVDNVRALRERGVTLVGPAIGRLTGKDTGAGRLAEPNEIAELAKLLLERPDALPNDLSGCRVLVTAGGTREALDPVRYLTNRSSGKQGYAIARVAAARGADVTLIAANVDVPEPAGAQIERVTSAVELAAAVEAHRQHAEVIVMAAAVSDFRPTAVSDAKLKKTDAEPEPIRLAKNPDILAGLVESRHRGELPETCVIVGFAAETGDETTSALDYGRAKLRRKGCDVMVVNAVGDGMAFEVEHNAGTIIDIDGGEHVVGRGSKYALASELWDVVRPRLVNR